MVINPYARDEQNRIDADLRRLKTQMNIGVIDADTATNVADDLIEREIKRLRRLKAELIG